MLGGSWAPQVVQEQGWWEAVLAQCEEATGRHFSLAWCNSADQTALLPENQHCVAGRSLCWCSPRVPASPPFVVSGRFPAGLDLL